MLAEVWDITNWVPRNGLKLPVRFHIRTGTIQAGEGVRTQSATGMSVPVLIVTDWSWSWILVLCVDDVCGH